MTSNVILVESGQCGNQVGLEIFRNLHQTIHSNDSNNEDDTDQEIFFRQSIKSNKLYARAVCLDTEPKVVQDCIVASKSSGNWQIDPRSVAYRHVSCCFRQNVKIYF